MNRLLKIISLSLVMLMMLPACEIVSAKNTTMPQVQEFYLDNGLKVLIKEDHKAPVFAQALFYKVGSRNDVEGVTGSAHFLEHMQFNGTQKRSKGSIPKEIEAHGGTFNAGTSYDYTVYHMSLPSTSENLEFAMELESDRMRNSIINTKEAERERQVVLEEMSRGENSPFQILYRETLKNIYPEHPYGDPIIGWRSDVENTTAQELKEQYDHYYQPNNAVLVLVGDIDPQKALETAKKYYGVIPASDTGNAPVAKRNPRPLVKKEVKLNIPSQSQGVLLAWDTVKFTDEDFMPLSILSSVLTSGDLSRLEKKLIDTNVATAVDSSARQGIDSFIFSIITVASKDKDLVSIEKAVLDEIEKIKTKGVKEEELQRIKAKAKTQFLLGLEEPMDMAMQLGFFEIIGGGWQNTFDWVTQIDGVTPADIQLAARKYLTEEKLFRGLLTDKKEELKAEQNNSTTVAQGVQAEKLKLDNGLTVILCQDETLPLISVHGVIDAGEIYENIGKHKYGTSSLVSMMLEKGTQKFSRDEIAQELEQIGASLSINTEEEYVDISGHSLSDDLDKLLSLLHQQLFQPTFPENEFNKLKSQIADYLEQSKDDMKTLARIELAKTLYKPEHPLYEPSLEEQIEKLEQININDLKEYQANYFSPNRLILAFSGDFDKKELLDLLQKYFGKLENTNSKLLTDSELQEYIEKNRQELISQQEKVIEVPGKKQANIYLGYPAPMNRTNPDYYAYLLANDILGGGSSLTSHLGYNVREKNGLVYSIYSINGAYRFPHNFKIQMGTSPETIDKAIDITKQTVKKFIQGNITDEEIRRAKNYRKGSFVSHSLVSNANIAHSLCLSAMWGLPLDNINNYPDNIENVSKEDIIRVAKKYFSPDKLQTVIAKPAK